MDDCSSLKAKLNANTIWPMEYMFKFIVPANVSNIARVAALFEPSAIVYHKESKNQKFVSITAKQSMQSAEQIIDIYVKAGEIPHLMAL